MPKLTPLINNFNAGEVSPPMKIRSDIDKYYSACRTLENMIPLVEGGTTRMPGSYYVGTAKNVPDYLIGWYKNDEGSGSTIINHATNGVLGGGLLPNLDVMGDTDIFWNTEPGFGCSPWPTLETDPSIAYAKAVLTEERTIGAEASFGIFYKRTGTWPSTYVGWLLNLMTIDWFQIELSSYNDGGDYVHRFSWDTTCEEIENLPNEWYFLFTDDTGLPKVVKSDGTIEQQSEPLETSQWSIENVNIGTSLSAISGYINGAGGVLGDAIIYNNKKVPISTPGDGYKPWSQWYDELRSRYGMAEKSGW